MAWLIGGTLLIGLVSGLYPAFVLSSFDPAKTLKGSFSKSQQGQWLRRGLVVFQFATTVALLSGIFIIHQQMDYLQNRPLGYNSDAVLEIDYQGAREVNDTYEVLRDELLKKAAIQNVSRHSGNVVGGLGNGWTTTVDGTGKEVSTSLYRMAVDVDYFDTYNIELLAGRLFSKDNPTDSEKAVLVNEAAVRNFGWATLEEALNKPFGKGERTRYVVGVVKDFHFESLHKGVEPLAIRYANRAIPSLSKPVPIPLIKAYSTFKTYGQVNCLMFP